MEKKNNNTTVVDISLLIEETFEYLTSIQVIIPNSEEVREYLHQYPDIIELVKFACEETRSRFPSSTQLSLELYYDPEFEDEYLILYIRQEKYADDIMNIVDDIRDNINSAYEYEFTTRSGELFVTTDFNFPR